jgi:A/G-specific adenine glycosylase
LNTADIEKLRSWFLHHQRDLPWRNDASPYAVWVSEVMLQQTQVAVVIPYFMRWMEQFPTIEALASAPIDSVIKCWEGLGYYSRARNLHAGAQYIVDHFVGKLPDSAEELAKIKGLGPYTIGAIRSFAFHQRAAAVDGNVIRVLCRYYNIAHDIGKSSTLKEIRTRAEEMLPQKNPWEICEALIELGATVCQKSPRCIQCPLKQSCQGFSHGTAAALPFKSKKNVITSLNRAVAVVAFEGKYLVRKGSQGAIMEGLYEFPYQEIDRKEIDDKQAKRLFEKELGLKLVSQGSLESIGHSFTRYRVTLYPFIFSTTHAAIENYEWLSINELHQRAFSSGHKRILPSLH